MSFNETCRACNLTFNVANFKRHLKTEKHLNTAAESIPLLYPLTINWLSKIHKHPKTVTITRRELAVVLPFIYQQTPSTLIQYHSDNFCSDGDDAIDLRDAAEHINEHTEYGTSAKKRQYLDDKLDAVNEKYFDNDDRVMNWCKQTKKQEKTFDIEKFKHLNDVKGGGPYAHKYAKYVNSIPWF
jgi:hypothetical protein